jgi:hypothetical protein
MLKKIMLGGLLVALVGVLVAGGINRAAARGGETNSIQHGQTTQSVAQRGGRNGLGGNQNSSEANATEWQAVLGTVSSVDASHLEIALSDGSSIEIGGRAWQLAVAQNFNANVGASVTLHGFNEDGVFQASQIDNQSNGQTLSLRDTTGRPLWAGRGRS